MKQSQLAIVMTCFFAAMQGTLAEDLSVTRPEMKQIINDLKNRQSRLPLPPPTEEQKASGKSLVNNGRLRSLYLPPSWQSFTISGWGGSRTPNVAATLKAMQQNPDYAFKTRLFWVVSRTNDCKYCLGHQELKLRKAGMTEDQIAALDCAWDRFPAEEQAAMKVARQMTIQPHLVNQNDLATMKSHYSDPVFIDLVYTISRFNSVNRWTSATGIPQDQEFAGEYSDLETATSPEFSTVRSKVAPLDHVPRDEWESREQFETAVAGARERVAFAMLPSLESAQNVLAKESPGIIPPVWFQAISSLPVALDVWAQRQALFRDGQTPHDLRILIPWVTARENRAIYAASHALQRLQSSGFDVSNAFSFSELEAVCMTPGYAEAIRFARRLTSEPHTIDDDDVKRLRQYFSIHEVAEIINLTADSNAFDRMTETLRLPLER